MKRLNQTAWGNYPKLNSDVFSPPFYSVSIPDECFIPQGNLRSYGDCALAPSAVSMLNHNKIISLDLEKGLINCQAGCLFSDILDLILPKGYFLPVTPGTKYITVGGAIASDVHGKNHHIDGSFSAHIHSFCLLLPDGTEKTCSKEEHSELFWLTCGGMGLTGIILSAKFYLRNVQSSFISQTSIKASSLKNVMELFETHADQRYSVAWIDCLSKGKNLGRSVFMVGDHSPVSDLSVKQQKQPFLVKEKQLKVPFYFPKRSLNTFSVKAFNFAYYYKQLKRQVESVVDYNTFFYPLDSILEWNKIYGKPGFVQYQCVIPYEKSYEGMKALLTHISDRGMGSFLAVLKLFGEQNTLMGFPMKGYTLALDFPITKALFPFLDELDKIVLKYGGRLYLTKDARMSKTMFLESYPNAKTFFSLLEHYVPGKKVQSLQSKRLGY